MARITVEDCLTKERNRFALVQLASKRAKQLLHGSKPSVLDARGNKSVVMALREIAAGQVRFMTDEEKQLAREQAQHEREARAAEAAAAAASQAALRGPDSIMKSPSENGGVVESNGLNGDNA
ncbi:MAG: DNA-directed RNA polymerase subunit omega [Deltaproteobacteria bacterium]|nr:DNA-directed RNA polymerase subunit omega [Deltaproteobacteria bacterium]